MKILLPLIVFLLPLTTRTLLISFTPGFHEYESIFLYAIDALLILAAILFFLARRERSTQLHALSLLSLLLIGFFGSALTSLFFASLPLLALYRVLRLGLVVVFALALTRFLKKDARHVPLLFSALAAGAVLESILAIVQFARQGSAGLFFLGEPRLSVAGAGIAKIAIDGAKILRAYGTFPHPNMLGIFLVIGLCALVYLLKEQKRHFFIRSLRLCGGGIVLIGLTLTFSRTAWAAAVLVVCFFAAHLYRHGERKQAATFLLFVCISATAIAGSLWRFTLPRSALSWEEPAVTLRLSYLSVAVREILLHPEGVGLGNQVYASVTTGAYRAEGLIHPWQWEPIHTIYLLIAVEIGVIGALSFIALLGILLWRLLRAGTFFSATIAAMLAALLLSGLTDHFLWSLFPGMLLLGIVFGMGLGVEDKSLPSFNG